MATERTNGNDITGTATLADHLPVLYMDWTMTEFRRNIKLPATMSHLHREIYEKGMEMSDPESGARMLVVPRGKRLGDASHICAADLDKLAGGA
ncbi:hypothetical protein psal_cds_452 [Pandoravirus salinus]|uniref:Uncharacterized protein n=1 Tax=Pandoravirus salinus TaxID=1349410 RepID=S4W1A7_9VIRU|nr:hypothetical protein psal_cds_452 [Pandoravirus salinus]AGO84207.1 hypothetical protein psal_cds_452 [Pandoravirus salinus]